MITNDENAGAGKMDGLALAGRQTGLLSRRSFLAGSAAGLGALGLGGCTTDGMSLAEAQKLYGPVPEEKFPIPAIDVSKVDPKYFRRTIPRHQGNGRHDHRRSRQLLCLSRRG